MLSQISINGSFGIINVNINNILHIFAPKLKSHIKLLLAAYKKKIGIVNVNGNNTWHIFAPKLKLHIKLLLAAYKKKWPEKNLALSM